MDSFSYDVEKLFNATKEILIEKNIENKVIAEILDNTIKNSVLYHLKYMMEKNIGIISILDEEYPIQLKEIYDPPACLYYKGNISILNTDNNIGIIGCRDCSEYGKKIAKEFANKISDENFKIVSGLARGIDSCAHIGAINKKTIAVIGTGLDSIYPKENIILSDEIIKRDGLIISEYPLGTKPSKYTFPQRNRIVSGICKGIIVIEAKKKSGTLITVDFALEQGRDVFVVPGNIDSENSVGTNDLIKQGAKMVTDYIDVINEYRT